MAETTVETGPSRSPWQTAWTAALIVASTLPLAFPIAFTIAAGGPRNSYWTYDAGLNAVSYFDTGFARRELAGTILRLFNAEPMAGSAIFHVITFALFAASGIYICCCRGTALSRQIALGAVLLGILAHIALDVGRTDAAVMTCGLAAAWAAREARWATCAAALSLALLFHEAGLIVLFPLVCAVAWASGSWRKGQPESVLLGAGLMVASLAAYAHSFQVHPDLIAIGRKVHSEFRADSDADMAVFANLAGFRGMKAAICTSMRNPLYWPNVVAGAAICVFAAFTLQPKRWRLAIMATLPVYVGLSLIATDVGRWSTFAVFCTFVMGALLHSGEAVPRGHRLQVAAAMAILALMSAGLTFTTVVFTPIPIFDSVARRAGLKSPDPDTSLAACDPQWRAIVGAEPAGRSR
jgi:hypothetical protein